METIIIISIFGIAIISLLTFFSLHILNGISTAINAEDKSEPEPSNKRKKKKKTAVASAPNEVFLNDVQKACAFLQSQGITPNTRTTNFFRIAINRKLQPSWISKDVNGQYYTFGAKGENLQKHKFEPLWNDYCSRTVITMYGEKYKIVNDKFIIPA